MLWRTTSTNSYPGFTDKIEGDQSYNQKILDVCSCVSSAMTDRAMGIAAVVNPIKRFVRFGNGSNGGYHAAHFYFLIGEAASTHEIIISFLG